MIRYGDLTDLAQQWRTSYITAEPFPHLVIDHVFDHTFLAEAAQEFPSISEMQERAGSPGVYQMSDRARLSPRLRMITDELLGKTFGQLLSDITETRVLTDPAGEWGTLRQSVDGVEGKIHYPPLVHGTKPWRRALILILTVTEGLDERNGGCLQLWDEGRETPRATLAPLFNRAVVFQASDKAFHSASRTSLGSDQTRKVIQALYFTEA